MYLLMTNQGRSSEDRIRQARERLGAGGDFHDGVSPDAEPVELDQPARETGEQAAAGTRVSSGSVTAPVPPSSREEPEGAPAPSDQDVGSRSKARVFTTRWFRVLVLVAIGLGYTFFNSLDDAGRDDTGEIVTAGDLDVMDVRPGDCFDDPDTSQDEVYRLQAVPCSQPHDNEVFAVESVAGSFGPEFPGDQALETRSYEVCGGAVFDAYVGETYLDSSLDVFTLTPTEDSWSEGDREVVCVLYSLDLSKLTRSARNSGL